MLAVLLLVNAFSSPGFFNLELRDGRLYGSLIDILNRAVPVLLLSLGMTLVIATGGVDLSVGSTMAISGAIAACLIARPADSIVSGLPIHGLPMIIAFSLFVGMLCGLFNGILVSVVKLQPIVATLLLMVAGRGVAQLLTNGQIVIFREATLEKISTGGTRGLPNPVWIFLFSLLLVGILMRKTAYGLFLEAVGNNLKAAEYTGLPTSILKTGTYVICGLCAGIAGIIVTGDIRAADASNAGLYMELDAILAVALGGGILSGGRFSLVGSAIGAILMQALTTTLISKGVPAEATLILKAGVVILVCLIQSPKFASLFQKRRVFV